MCPDLKRLIDANKRTAKSLTRPGKTGTLARQQGMGLPMALFIILILSIVGLAVNRLADTSSQNYSSNIAAQQAYLMAYSAIQQQLIDTLAVDTCQCTAANTTVTLAVAGLNSCQAVVSCSSFVAEGQTYCDISSAASCDGGNGTRTLEVRVK